jgi:HAD superfamily hydrolase (TIGR01490 family)
MVAGQPDRQRIAAFFDVDRTLLRGSSMLALAGPLGRAGLLSRRTVLRAAVRGLQFSVFGSSEKGVRQSARSIGEAVRGLEVAGLRRIVDRAVPQVLAPRVYEEALRLISWHRVHDHLVFLVSASTRDLIVRLGEIVGADGVVASEAEVVSGRYTGEVELCHGAAKARAVNRLARAYDIDLGGSYAYGDAAGDIPMLETVGHAVAVNPDRGLRAAAGERGWQTFRFRSPVGWAPLAVAGRPVAPLRVAAPRPRPEEPELVGAVAAADGVVVAGR